MHSLDAEGAMLVRECWRELFDAATLVAEHPPRWRNGHKRSIWRLVEETGPESGEVHVSRWARAQPREPLRVRMPRVRRVGGFFDYTPDDGVSWWLNFADSELFCAYGSSLLAQDELQVLEHPILGSVREALVSKGRECRTVGVDGPSPVLIRGCRRRLHLATNPDPHAGRPAGLYGNRFAAAPLEVVMRAVEILDSPRPSNILAMAAPEPAFGRYDRSEIEFTWNTAVTGFAAARVDSSAIDPQAPVYIHTGLWGCGAFGGNRELMLLLQLAAAGAVGLGEIIFHIPDEDGSRQLAAAENRLAQLIEASGTALSEEQLVERLDQAAFQWGESDGN